MKITILPWRNDSELAFVRDCFYPRHVPTEPTDIYSAVMDANIDTDAPETSHDATTTSRYSLGIQRVAIWSFKSPRSVPRAVTTTAKLIDAKLHDEKGHRTVPLGSTGFRISHDMIKSIYAMTFSRFVNSFVDRDVVRLSSRSDITGIARTAEAAAESDSTDEDGYPDKTSMTPQMKGTGESSMYAHAVTIGMPAHFVDLRHQCVHGELPDLDELRKSTDQALEWLWTRWWKVNSKGDSGRFRAEMEEWRARDDGGLAGLIVQEP